MHPSRWHGAFAAVLLFAALDVAAAQLLKRTMPAWNVPASERRYRVPVAPYHHGLKPRVQLEAYWGGVHYPMATNSLGFRDERVRDVAPHDDAPRVLFLGDSFTEGVGVAFADTYVGRLRRPLGARGVDVLNAAASSYAPSVYYRKAKYLIEEVGLDFDALLVGIDISDVSDEALNYRLDAAGNVVGLRPAAREPSGPGALAKDNSVLLHVASMARSAWKRRSEVGGAESLGVGRENALWTVDRARFEEYGEEGLRRARARMDQLLRLADEHGIRVAVLVYPWPDQIARGDIHSEQVRFWKAWADSAGVPLYDAFPAFFRGGSPEATIRRAYIPFDVHWNAEGHRLVEETLVREGFPEFVLGAVAARRSRARPLTGRAAGPPS